MAGRSGTSPRGARWLLAALLLAGVWSTPGVAAAAPADGLTPGHGPVTPLVDCVRVEGPGTFTAVLGYSNSGTATEHLFGVDNNITPAAYDGVQPTKFSSGTQHGVFTIRVTGGGSASWTVDGTTVVASATSPACPASAQLPADGNGAGPVIAAMVAGVVGAVALLRRRRRLDAAA